MNRRGLLKGILAAGMAPYVCTAAGVLMPPRHVVVPRRSFPVFYGDSIMGSDEMVLASFDRASNWIAEYFNERNHPQDGLLCIEQFSKNIHSIPKFKLLG